MSRPWDVFLPNPYGTDQLIDTVFYDDNCDAEWVWHGLVNHDGYNPSIYVESGSDRHPPEE